MPTKKIPPCEQYGPNYMTYTRKGEQLCRKRKQKREDKILEKMDTIIELLKKNSGPVFRAPPPPPPPPPPSLNRRPVNRKKSPPKKVDPLIMARASLMNNLKKALIKRKKD